MVALYILYVKYIVYTYLYLEGLPHHYSGAPHFCPPPLPTPPPLHPTTTLHTRTSTHTLPHLHTHTTHRLPHRPTTTRQRGMTRHTAPAPAHHHHATPLHLPVPVHPIAHLEAVLIVCSSHVVWWSWGSDRLLWLNAATPSTCRRGKWRHCCGGVVWQHVAAAVATSYRLTKVT